MRTQPCVASSRWHSPVRPACSPDLSQVRPGAHGLCGRGDGSFRNWPLSSAGPYLSSGHGKAVHSAMSSCLYSEGVLSGGLQGTASEDMMSQPVPGGFQGTCPGHVLKVLTVHRTALLPCPGHSV